MKKKVLVPVITIPVISLLAVGLYLVRKARLNQKELQEEVDNIGPDDLTD